MNGWKICSAEKPIEVEGMNVRLPRAWLARDLPFVCASAQVPNTSHSTEDNSN